MAKVYINGVVQACQTLYQHAPIQEFSTTTELIAAHADLLFQAHQNGNNACVAQFNNWHPDLIGADEAKIFGLDLTVNDALLALSKEFGYADWEDAKKREARICAEFENAVDMALQGELENLETVLVNNPQLATATSPFGHRATILLYMGSNGVEMWRQTVPENICTIIESLIKMGADENAKANVYGGRFNVLQLAESSNHPIQAGVVDDLIALLKNLLAE